MRQFSLDWRFFFIGHGNKNHTDDQRAPIFLQFVDILWQMTQQMPCAFEFNELMLFTILDCLYSCKYGTFLCNSEKERMGMAFICHNIVSLTCDLLDNKLPERTSSLWAHILANETLYTNLSYMQEARPLTPIYETQHLQLWKSYYLRHYNYQRYSKSVCIMIQLISFTEPTKMLGCRKSRV